MAKWAIKNKTENQNNPSESWENRSVYILLTIVFLVVESLGLIVAISLFNQGFSEAPFGSDINDPINAIWLFLMILIMTGFILLIIKLKKERKFLILMETLTIFLTSTLVLQAIIPNKDSVIFLVSLLVVVIRNIDRENVMVRNAVSGIAIIGTGAILGISIGLLPVLLFIIALAIYDIIAVFGTKHMVVMGKAVTKQNFAFTIAMPTKAHTFELGNGDLVIPLIVATSVFVNAAFQNNALISALVLISSFIGLCISIYLVSQRKVAMPALPPQTLLMLIVIGTAILLGL